MSGTGPSVARGPEPLAALVAPWWIRLGFWFGLVEECPEHGSPLVPHIVWLCLKGDHDTAQGEHDV